MKITRANAIAMFVALGFGQADKWNNTRLQQKLSKLNEVVEAGTKLEGDNQKNLEGVLAALEAKQAIEVEANNAAAPATEAPAAQPAADGAPAATAPKGGKKKAAPKAAAAATTDAAGAATTTTPGGTGKKKEKAPAAPKQPKEPAIPGVREVRSRPFLSGVVIKEMGGLAVGVTDAMVAKVDAMYGKANPVQTKFDLQSAWHAIRGFLNGDKPKTAEGTAAAE